MRRLEIHRLVLGEGEVPGFLRLLCQCLHMFSFQLDRTRARAEPGE
jgi:hypothetical protein